MLPRELTHHGAYQGLLQLVPRETATKQAAQLHQRRFHRHVTARHDADALQGHARLVVRHDSCADDLGHVHDSNTTPFCSPQHVEETPALMWRVATAK